MNPYERLIRGLVAIVLAVAAPLTLLYWLGSSYEPSFEEVPQPWLNVEGPINFQDYYLDYEHKVVTPKAFSSNPHTTGYESPYSTEAIIVNSEVEIEDLVDYYGYY